MNTAKLIAKKVKEKWILTKYGKEILNYKNY